jgi:hypothetical protein
MTWNDAEMIRYRAGVGIMLLNWQGQVFVGRRIDMPVTPAWQMPQGVSIRARPRAKRRCASSKKRLARARRRY